MRLTELIKKRVRVVYKTKAGFINDQQVFITYVGPDKVAFNIGRKEIFIGKNQIETIKDEHGNLLYKK